MNSVFNPFLSEAMRAVRRGRPMLPLSQPFFNRVEQVPAGKYAEVWFITEGCTWDHAGGCTMCNYGQGVALPAEETVSIIRQALAELPAGVTELMVSPSGGFFDDREVPPVTRRDIFALVQGHPCSTFLVETRSETVTSATVGELVRSVRDKRLVIEVGLESCDPWIQQFCVNKGSDPARFEQAAGLARDAGVKMYANVCLGTAFLSEAEVIVDASRSVIWALTHGADTTVLFPLHVKPFTLLATLYWGGRYKPVSLWSLVEVLKTIAAHNIQFLRRTEIAWYKSYYDDATKTMAPPSTCPSCIDDVIRLLDRYRARQDSQTVDELDSLFCTCKHAWRAALNSPVSPLVDRVLESYEWVSTELGLQEFWRSRSAEITALAKKRSEYFGENLARRSDGRSCDS